MEWITAVATMMQLHQGPHVGYMNVPCLNIEKDKPRQGTRNDDYPLREIWKLDNQEKDKRGDNGGIPDQPWPPNDSPKSPEVAFQPTFLVLSFRTAQQLINSP